MEPDAPACARRPELHFVCKFVAESLQPEQYCQVSKYFDALDRACQASSPTYATREFGDAFRQSARDPDWLVNLLVSDADMEGYSASRLWEYAHTLLNTDLGGLMCRHAWDEAKHSRMFAEILFLVFPSLDSPELRAELRSYSPVFSAIETENSDGHVKDSSDELLNSLVLVNLFETKALILAQLLKPVVVAYAPATVASKVSKMMDIIIDDESRHIFYTARELERLATSFESEKAWQALADFQQTMNEVTDGELEREALASATEVSGVTSDG